MPSRVAQLMALLEEAKEKGDTDKVKEIESDLFKEKKAKGETFFGRPKDLPATRDFYRATGKPLDVMSKTGVNYMKDAGLIKPPKLTTPNTGGGDGQQLCPDGTYPPCKTPVTQIKKPVSQTNSFLSNFQSYDDGGEIVISSNVDKNLL